MSEASEEKSDGLEIISIGKLYSGAWEKKYWSSSRGKDRYPYPVGFKAVRTQNGLTYRMEICEGVKGPVFMISSNDELSCSGQTPDIAWESFQKKSCSRVKFWHGKRFSCKIDGMEFFGFKNAFVQRLLRELVANVGGTVEQNLLPSRFCVEASATRDPIQLTDFSVDHDMLSDLASQRVIGKRCRKDKIIKPTSKIVPDLKRVQPQNRDHGADSSSCGLMCQADCNDRLSSMIPGSQEENVLSDNEKALLRSGNLEPVTKEEELLASVEDNLLLNSSDASHRFKVDRHYSQEQSKPVSSRTYTTIRQEGNLPKEKEPFNSSIREDEGGESMCPKTVHDAELCVPDTLDHQPDYPSNSFLRQVNTEVPIEDSCNLEDVIAPDIGVPEVLETESESLREDETGTSNSNASSEKGDLDSVGQEIAKSMMTVLLPRALPLLKIFSRKKKKNVRPSEMSTHITMAENDKTVKVASPVAVGELKENPDLDQNKKARISVRNYEDDGRIKSVVPDSFDDDESGNLVNDKLPLLGTTNIHCKTELLLNTEFDECNDLTSKAYLGVTSPLKKDTFTNVSENSLYFGKQPAEDDNKTFPDCNEDILDPTTSFLDQELADFDMPTSYSLIQRQSCSDDVVQNQEVKDGPKVNNSVTWKHDAKPQDVLKLIACYVHPMPISALVLSMVGDKIYICALCGSLAQEDKILFIYNAPITGEKTGSPSFVGHASIVFPTFDVAFGSHIAVDVSGLQFTPNGQSLVLLNSIKVPCCREGNIHCPCPPCSSDCFEKNAVKIVHVKFGYVSVVNKLKTAQNVRCILVCEPDEGGKLYLWVMDSLWSSPMDEFNLHVPDHWPSSLVELKKIPNSASLIIGHNGFGEFSLWDIKKCILISKFSAPSTTISKCIPIGLFPWQRKGTVPPHSSQAEVINDVLEATKMWFSGTYSELVQPKDGEDLAIWLLISTVSSSEFQHGYQSGDWQMDSVGSWRLALLVKNTVVMGSPMDLRAAVIGASVGHGIVGRSDGLVYIWELSTGMKVGDLYQFKGSGVSCIVTDSSKSRALAVASDGGELLVYMYR